ncbi:MAG: HAD hydrolase-like protein [Candidatus Endonucleobacter sp. (ex Gigantidas childressi)]|nr:HAD hydrolase-like protein [Candidatus Endonucleobacter sp. (ex Gigantidas childressi)]
MIKNILWDFDGVIIDSMKIKGEGFVELFNQHSKEKTDRLYKYHLQNGGVSRFEKIKYFYESILGEGVTESDVRLQAEKFGSIVISKLCKKENLIKDSLRYIQRRYNNFNFHIVSGSEEKELRFLCKELYLSQYFVSINGSPTPKSILVESVLKQNKYKKNETILIGDALTDANAAEDNGIKFYAYNNIILKQYSYIYSFKDMDFE